MIAQIIALFGAGVASFLAPCIVPLVPAYLGIIVGEVGDAHDPARAVPATLIFIAGFTTVFAGLGAVAGLLGSSLSTFQDIVRVVGGVVIIVMGLALLGVARTIFGRERRLIPQLPAIGGVARPYVVGVAFGAGWTPCLGPILGAILTYTAATADLARGLPLLLAYSLGLAIPFLIAAVAVERFLETVTRFRPHLARVSQVSGALLVIVGVMMMLDVFTVLGTYLQSVTPAGLRNRL